MIVPAFRFAPSPNGRLHLGHAYSALLNEDLARRTGGRLLVRIEDIDPVRSRPELASAILDDLAWLGLQWEEPVRRQSDHLDDYGRALDRLRQLQVAYPCFCTRAQVKRAAEEGAAASLAASAHPPRDPDGAPLYPGTCRHLDPADVRRRLEEGRTATWRLDVAAALRAVGPVSWTAFEPDGAERRIEARPFDWGDPIVARRDIATSYHLAVVVDDAVQGITHVVRGRDLERATDLHALLQGLLDLPSPRYHHHALLRDEDGRKLAKSLGSRPLQEARRAGVTAAEIRQALGFAAAA